MTTHEACHALVQRTGTPDALCLEKAVPHVGNDLYLLRDAWVGRELRIGWTLWFITARLLMGFFFTYERKKHRSGRYADDILAADFLPIGEWKNLAELLKKERPAEYDDCRVAANKLAAHLTYSRVHLAASANLQPSIEVHDYLYGVAGMWLDLLRPERRAWFDPWFPTRGAA